MRECRKEKIWCPSPINSVISMRNVCFTNRSYSNYLSWFKFHGDISYSQSVIVSFLVWAESWYIACKTNINFVDFIFSQANDKECVFEDKVFIISRLITAQMDRNLPLDGDNRIVLNFEHIMVRILEFLCPTAHWNLLRFKNKAYLP